MRRITAAVLPVAGIAALGVAAQAVAEDSGFYLGVNAAQAMYDIDQAALDDLVVSALATVGVGVIDGVSSLDDEDTSFSATLGYRINRYLAVEAAYLDLGEASYGAHGLVTDGFVVLPLDVALTAESAGPALSAVGYLPMGDAWELFARAGVFFADTEYSIAFASGGESYSESVSESGEEMLWGLGIGYHFGERFGMRVEFQRIMDVGADEFEADVDALSLGMTFAF